ncbi:hypothetical protein B0J15DRAFT_469772 [Fusarium solani]|uniref:Uncharacterized protein n=1 Tax=Fusarium solani TaxID=169388 RepID=A0A9P9GQI2_FUSSL|nr:uncharacterized protein B0J15DRAFT_469772 [Fusarium solani]KAH7243874.1 hypothetical protein B0J15DRAFT_469772 [Fusarium solani]
MSKARPNFVEKKRASNPFSVHRRQASRDERRPESRANDKDSGCIRELLDLASSRPFFSTIFKMNSPTQSPETATILPETILLGNKNDLGWGQDQYQYQYQNQDQMAFHSFRDQASLVSNMWGADISSGSERFAHDPSIAFGLSDISQPGPPSLDQKSTDGNSKDSRDSLELRRPATDKVNEPPLMGENGPLDCLACNSDSSSGHPDVKLRSASRKPKNSGCPRLQDATDETAAITPGQYFSRYKF